MNIFFVIGDEVLTPNLDGAILAGITRDSIITLLKDRGIKITERLITIGEVMEAGEKGTLKEVFGAGTAAVVAPVCEIKHGHQIVKIDPDSFKISKMIYETINGLRNSTVEDTHGWIVPA